MPSPTSSKPQSQSQSQSLQASAGAKEGNIRLLCFDGGGVRGLASLYVLKQCLSYIGDVRPCEVFDMIGGSSTGGLIALMLGRLEMSVQECIGEYIRLMQMMFSKKQKKIYAMGITGRVKERYSANVMEMGVKGIIKRAGYSEDELLRGRKRLGSKCKTFVTAVAQGSSRVTIFSDYKKQGESSSIFDDIKIWEAARATCALPSFFEPMTISNSGVPVTYIDGGVGANNPVNKLWTEALNAFEPPVTPRVVCLLSIGAGRPKLTAAGESILDVPKFLTSLAFDTERTHLDFLGAHPELSQRHAYWRFDPPDIHGDVKLDEVEKLEVIIARTDSYGDRTDQALLYREFARVAALQNCKRK